MIYNTTTKTKINTNMKNLLTALIIILAFTACDDPWDCTRGDGPIVARELNLEEIDGIELSGSDRVFLSIGEEQEVIVEGQQNIINELNTNVRNGFWDIRFRNCVKNNRGLEFYITVREINEVNLSGSGEIILEDPIETEQLEIRLAGSGEIQGAVDVSTLDIDITGSGTIELSGRASDAWLKIAGSGELDAYDLLADNYDIQINGSGNAEVYVQDNLKVDISGSGSVNYKGSPSIDSKISGSGKVNDKN